MKTRLEEAMNRKPNHTDRIAFSLCVCLLLTLTSLSCGFKKPWRSYEQQPFDSQKWREGDAITRGTMLVDLYRSRKLDGMPREEVVKLLGEPDKKRASNEAEVWLYQIEVVGEKPRRYFPVSFDKGRGASAGSVKDGTRSMVTDE
jgi:hypothetical protein